MRKKTVIILATLLIAALVILAMAMPGAFAALTDPQQKELDTLYQKLLDIQKQIVQKKVEFGIITSEQGEWQLDHLNLMYKYRGKQQPGSQGYGPGGTGCPMVDGENSGMGMMGRGGMTQGGMMGGGMM